MKKFFAFLFAALALSASGIQATEPSEAVSVLTKKYDFKDFQSLSVSYTFKVDLVQDNDWSVEVEYSDFMEEYLDITAGGGTLHLGVKSIPRSLQNSRKFKDGPVLRATVHMPRLTRLAMSGASKLVQEGRFSLTDEDFRLDLSGASSADNLAVDARKARLVMSGASKLGSLKGSFYQVNMGLSGAARAYCDAAAEDWDITLSGSAHVELNGADCQTLDIESSGASKADVYIPSGSLQYEGTGASNLNALDAPTRKAKIELSGSSSCRVAVKESIEVEASGASTCRYKAVDDAPLRTKFDSSRGSRIVSL